MATKPFNDTELARDDSLEDDSSVYDEVSSQDKEGDRRGMRVNERIVPEGPVYEKNAQFASLLVRALDSWWAASATPQSARASRDACGLLLRYGCALVEFAAEFPEDFVPRYPEVDAAEAQAAYQVARELVDEAEAVTGPSAARELGRPIAREFHYAEGHASLLALWQMASVYCRLYSTDQRLSGTQDVMEDIGALFDADSPRDVPTFLEGIICYLGFNYPELNDRLSAELAGSVKATCLMHGPLRIAPTYVPQMYQRIRTRSKLRRRVPRRAALGSWVLSHRLLWDITWDIQKYSLAILKDVDECCRELGIDYFLVEGALLGAMRHGGFIPWDDDIDIGMLREDYDRFVREAPAYFGSKYAVDTYETNPKHWTISGKVQMTEKTDYISLKAEGLALSNGPFVDIFAFDNSPYVDGKELIRRGRRISALRALLYYRTGFQKRPSVRKAFRKKLLSNFTSVEYLHREIDDRCREYQGVECPYVSNFGSLYKVELETFAVEDIKPVRQVDFCGMKVNVPNNAEAVLEKIYGDWHELPPFETRLGKHRFIKREDYEAELAKHIAGA